MEQRGEAEVFERIARTRRSTRAFVERPLPLDEVRELLALAATAPSNSNTQPWQVHVVTGAAQEALSERLLAAFDAGVLGPPDHFPEPLPEAPAARQQDFAARYYASLRIERGDTAARTRQSRRNLVFFGAPVGLVLTIDERLRSHSWLDAGLFLQTLLLGAAARGWAACPQVTFARFHEVIARQLRFCPHERTVCGVSLGWPDPQAPVNRFELGRTPPTDFARFHA